MDSRRAPILMPIVFSLCLAGCGGGTIASQDATPASSARQQADATETPLTTITPGSTSTATSTPLSPTPIPTPTAGATAEQQPTPTPPPAVPAPNGMITFYSERDGNAEIYVMRSDGSDLRRLTDHPADDVCPAWSPDGQTIAFISTRNDPDPASCLHSCAHDIYLKDLDAGTEVQLTDTEWNELHPSWSPDGRSIVFASDQSGNGDIYVMDSGGGEPRQLTNHPAEEMRPAWSPDGRTIAFNSMRDGNWHIYLMPAEGGEAVQLTQGETWNLFPDWSPDGKQIIFFTMLRGSQKQDVAVMNADGTDIRKLTGNPRTVDEDAAWSPDGSQIAYQSDRDGNFEIYIMQADGSAQRNLTNAPSDEYWPDWKPLDAEVEVAKHASSAVTGVSNVPILQLASRPATHSVCASGCDFKTIQAAVDSPDLGQDAIVELRDPVFTEPGIVIDRSISIRGMGPEETVVQASEALSDSPERVIEVKEGAEVTLEGIMIRHGNPSNDEIGGGGLINYGTLVISECVIADNSANDGAGLYNRGSVTLVRSTVRDNLADASAPAGYECGSGGGIKSTQGTLVLIDSTISGNRAGVDDRGKGGGVFIACDCDARFVNSTISGNKTVRYGGGVAVMGTLELIHSTIARNISREPGSGVYVRGEMDYVNSLIADNYGGDNCVIGGQGGFKGKGRIGSSSGNLVEGGGCDATFSDDSLLDRLADNGGPTLTHALKEGSPAIDAIAVDGCMLPRDQRGEMRPAPLTLERARCDIGALELQRE